MSQRAMYVGVTVFGLVASLVLGELLVRMAAGPPALMLYSGSFRDVQTDWDIFYGVHDQGRRTSCLGNRAQTRVRRVAVIGDSFVFGQGVEDCKDFVSLLNKKLPTFAFENLGLIGVGLNEYYMVVRDLVDESFTDVLVVVYGNDISQFSLRRSMLGRLADTSSSFALLRKAWRSHLVQRRLKEASAAGHSGSKNERWNNIKAVVQQDPSYFYETVEPREEGRRDFSVRFGELADLLRDRVPQDRVWIAMVPESVTVSVRLRDFVSGVGGRLPSYGKPGAGYELVRRLAEAHGLRWIDTYAHFLEGGEDLYFNHDMHWTAAGHGRMADAIMNAINAQ